MVPVIYYLSESHPELECAPGRARGRWYGVEPTLLPLAFFDGTGRAPQVTVPDSFYPVYRDMIEGARSHPTFLEVAVESGAADTNGVALRVRIEPTDSVVDTMRNLRLVAVVYEDSVGYYSMLRGDTVYVPRVVRAVVGDSAGLPLRLRFGAVCDTLVYLPGRGWRLDHLGCAVAVQDGVSRAVFQSAVVRRWEVNTGGVR